MAAKGQLRTPATHPCHVRSWVISRRSAEVVETSVHSHKQTQAAPQRQTNLWRIAMPVAGAAAPPQPDSKPSLGWSNCSLCPLESRWGKPAYSSVLATRSLRCRRRAGSVSGAGVENLDHFAHVGEQRPRGLAIDGQAGDLLVQTDGPLGLAVDDAVGGARLEGQSHE